MPTPPLSSALQSRLADATALLATARLVVVRQDSLLTAARRVGRPGFSPLVAGIAGIAVGVVAGVLVGR